jgi:outer membrane protein OmpA-like peptidoglycan-associated protein
MNNIKLLLLLLLVIIGGNELLSQNDDLQTNVLNKAKIEAARKEVDLTIQSVDISKFPTIKVLIEAFNKLGEPLDSLSPDNVFIYENGERKKVISVEKVPVAEKISIDFVFVVDKTGSMQQSINAVRNNIVQFTKNLVQRGIDYRLGLVSFSDEIEKIHQPTTNVYDFLDWISNVKAYGGGDEKENALEALAITSKMTFRKEATKVIVLITDAPYHQAGEQGAGLTNYNTNTLIEQMQKNQLRVFSITPESQVNYQTISKQTRGSWYDLDYPFSTVLDNFSNQLTNLYFVTYESNRTAVPDSIEIGIYDPKTNKVSKKSIPIVELGRKLILEHLLFGVASYQLPPNIPELDVLAEFMKSKPGVRILIEGHTDAVGNPQANVVLSEKRAVAVRDYLISRGIESSRLETIGFGKSRPIASNATIFGRQLNRRTELVIISK